MASICVRNGKGLERVADRGVVDGVVEICGHGEDAADGSVDLLIDGAVVLRIEFAHVVAVDHVDVRIFSCADGEVVNVAGCISEVGQHKRAAGAEIFVAVGFGDGVRGLEVVGDGESSPFAVETLRNPLPKSPLTGKPLAVRVVSKVPLASRK